MCRTKMAVDAAEPSRTPRTNSRTPTTPSTKGSTSSVPRNSEPPSKALNPSISNISNSSTYNYSSSTSSYRLDTSTATATANASLSSLRGSLPENTRIYDFSEIRSATNNFLAKRFSSSSSSPSWRCSIRGKEVIVFQRKIRRPIQTSELKEKLSVIGRSHHLSIVKLHGASISGDHIYLVYEFIAGASLSDCLRNPRNPDFTVLSTWMSRMQITADMASGLDYIHNNSRLNSNPVHKYVKASSVIVTEPSFNAKICHFGTAELCGETTPETKNVKSDEIVEDSPDITPKLNRSDSRSVPFEGVIGYMSPEFQLTGVATQESDVYAFGILILELLTGEKPVKHKFDKASGEYRRISIVDAAREAVHGGNSAEVEGKLRRWMDRRLKDSFPVEVVDKLTRVALTCVDLEPDKRPNMGRVAGKISKMYLDSRKWSDRVQVPTAFSVSFAPR